MERDPFGCVHAEGGQCRRQGGCRHTPVLGSLSAVVVSLALPLCGCRVYERSVPKPAAVSKLRLERVPPSARKQWQRGPRYLPRQLRPPCWLLCLLLLIRLQPLHIHGDTSSNQAVPMIQELRRKVGVNQHRALEWRSSLLSAAPPPPPKVSTH